ncbi:MAG: Zn-dependent hydrolase of the metallo-beta-lactamase superfamily [Parcubacteria group bacterium GW2011_GWA2_47_21]|nr:MAG: Zn-dependent hydrolase of the metallo-beta-lactamase superfamily [Parcubacteria group bacterium GW2011_GWA2_47_21]
MIITYHGAECVRLQFGNTVIALGPISKESNLKAARFGADMTLISLNHADTNGFEAAAFGDKQPFIVQGPGEYEIKDVLIKGFLSASRYDGKKPAAADRINTVYQISLEGMNLCYLGAINTKDLPHEANEAIDNVDILFIPIGGEGVLTPAEAYKLSVAIEPKIIIPIHFGEIGVPNALKNFLKESGAEGVKPIEKLTVKKKDLEGKEGEIVVLKEP